MRQFIVLLAIAGAAIAAPAADHGGHGGHGHSHQSHSKCHTTYRDPIQYKILWFKFSFK